MYIGYTVNLSLDMRPNVCIIENKLTSTSLLDFNYVCRICLAHREDLVNLFDTGLDLQIMELTRLSINCKDQLPTALCRECSVQLNQSQEFVRRARVSDEYLRSALRLSAADKVEGLTDLDHKRRRNRIPENSKRNEKQAVTDKDDDPEIRKEKDSEKRSAAIAPGETDRNSAKTRKNSRPKNFSVEDVKLASFWYLDHTYPKEILERKYDPGSGFQLENGILLPELVENFVEETASTPSVYRVNLFVYQCNKCFERFETEENFRAHARENHGPETSFFKSEYLCPVCFRGTTVKHSFLDHLQTHRENGVTFSKVNAYDKEQCLLNDEHDVPIANKTIYTCPVCCDVCFDDQKSFVKHLISHESQENSFVKVDNADVFLSPIEDTFLDSDELVKLDPKPKIADGFQVSGTSVPVCKIRAMNSCDDCDFIATSRASLKQHYFKVHDSCTPTIPQTTCPVCGKLFELVESEDPEQLRKEFRDHLTSHDNILFLKVGTDGKLLHDPHLFDSQAWIPNTLESKDYDYVCDVCCKRFKKKQEIATHLKLHQTKTKQHYVCEKCGRTCVGRANYNRHFSTHFNGELDPRRSKWKTCNKDFACQRALNEYVREHGNNMGRDSRIICEVCGQTFSVQASLTKHLKLHASGKEKAYFKCNICERKFHRQYSYDRHISAHLNPNYLECNLCRLPLPSRGSILRHSKVHEITPVTFDCKVCELSFFSKDELNMHQTSTGHHRDKKSMECNVCHKKFFVGKLFAEHIKVHPKYKSSECNLCGKKLATTQSLMLHIGRHFETNRILCQYCGRQFFEEKNYRRHLLTHNGIKPYSCDVDKCGKSFYTLFELKRHKKYHSNTRDFACPHCSKSFHESNHLRVHVRSHTGERPYTCPHCNKGFVTRTRCKQHIKLIHQGVGYDMIQSKITKKVAVFGSVDTSA